MKVGFFGRLRDAVGDEREIAAVPGGTAARLRGGPAALGRRPRPTLPSPNSIAEATRERFDLSAPPIVRRRGTIAPGEAIVFAAATAAKRRADFEAVEHMMGRLKADAAVWKRADGPAGPRWTGPGQDDGFIFCLPGSAGACRDGWDLVLGLALDSRYRPCSFAEQVPRLRPFFE